MSDSSDAVEVTREAIVAGLRSGGLSAGDGVMVHSSLKSFGRVQPSDAGPGGAAGAAMTVIEALMEAVTPAGTLLLPSFNHGKVYGPDGPGWFDPAETPTTNGIIPETFRRLAGVRRSIHPTHAFAAWGAKAAEYTQGHHRTLTCGADSPLGRLWRDGGWGLLLGVGYRANTFHHVVETTTGAPCLGRRTVALPMRIDGRSVEGRTWGWRDGGCPITDATRYAEVIAARGLQRETMIGACPAILFRLQDAWEVIAELLRDGLGEFPPCRRCPIRPRVGERAVPSDWDEKRGRLKPDSPAWGY